ncbi:sugar ABC transporter permease [Natrarchaeobius halalkaliphilus]|uniref:Sugar ABC transporter permease n=1 Tax=Natrarchaeobius halalkaliphilus TaxID=1679091 RepID=A0A3N6P0K8_9EURY|nr:sugar ABC transporter permease [Natrarchaeobius halalkaliphilus]RQG88038.1 sugar ABC transporter permease [Natrarchaeobius halalkaliphilus]
MDHKSQTVHRTSSWHRVRDRLFETLSSKRNLALLTVLPALTLFALINIVPILWAIYAGFHDIFIFDPEWTWYGLENYRILWSDQQFHTSIIRSTTFAIGTVAFQATAGILIAVLVAREFRFNRFARAMVMMGYLIPTAIVAYMAYWMGNSTYGVVNWILLNLGLIDGMIAWFGDSTYAMISVIGVNWWKYTAFVVIMALARLQSIPDSHYEAARVSGASAWRQFRDITLPNLKGVIFIVLLLRGVWMFLHFDSVWILTRGGPGDSTMVSAVYAYETAFIGYDLGLTAAMSTVLFGILVVAAIIYFIVLEPEEEVRVE